MSTNYFSAANAHFCRIAEPSSRGRNIGNYFPDRGRKQLAELNVKGEALKKYRKLLPR